MEHNTKAYSPEGFFKPPMEIAAQGIPIDALTCCISRLDSILAAVEADGLELDQSNKLSDSVVQGLLWAARGQVDTLQYILEVLHLQKMPQPLNELNAKGAKFMTTEVQL